MWTATLPTECVRVGVAGWAFHNAVGVDCSTPEPRCVWVAVLQGDTPLRTHTPVSTQESTSKDLQSSTHDNRAKGRRDEILLSNENPRPVVGGGAEGRGMSWQGPRTLVLRKNSQGFGFTLRHFIVYPPESALHTSLKDQENGNEKGLQQHSLEPMDTIFVKNVRERGPAHQAGLSTGDRLVKVNGESVLGKTYSQVIALIQNSESVLELSIMPKDEDVLQLAYSHDAYLRGNDPFTGGAQDLPPPPPLCYPPREPSHAPCPTPSHTHMGQNQLDNWSRWPGSSPSPAPPPLDNRTGAHAASTVWAPEGRVCELGGVSHNTPAHRTEEVRYRTSELPAVQTRGRSYSSASNASPVHHARYVNHSVAPGNVGGRTPVAPPTRSQLTQKALSDWYYSQRPASRSLHPRLRSYSQDRLGEPGRARRYQPTAFPHSASQDTLLHLQAPGGSPAHTQRYGRVRAGRSLEALDQAAGPVSPKQERPPLRSHAPEQASQATPPTRRLPSCQSVDEQPIGYRSYSPAFNRKTGRFLQQAQSFRQPCATPRTTPLGDPEPTTAAPPPAPPPAPSTPAKVADTSHQPTNHDRAGGDADIGVRAQAQEVVLRQKPPTGRRGGNGQHPHYALALDASDPLLFTPDPAGAPPKAGSSVSQRRGNDEPTSPSADLRACHVPASSVVSSGGLRSAPAVATSPASSPTFMFPLSRLFSHDCTSVKSSRRSSYLLAITTERSKSCDEGLNTFRDDGRAFSRLPKRVQSFFGDGSLESLGPGEDCPSKRHSASELLCYSGVGREGWLHYKQVHSGKGKKVGSAMRPWRRVFSVLRSNSLYLYKDKREALLKGAALGGGSEEEQPISIGGCLVDIAYSETKRKNTLRLTTQDFSEYLLQAEDREDMLEWTRAIREISKTHSEELGFSPQALISKKLNDYRKQSLVGSKPDSSPLLPRMTFMLTKADSSSTTPRSPKHEGKEESSPPKSPWGINFMKKVKRAGPKAFGVRLEDCQSGTSNKFIPLIVEICCSLVEELGLESTGIYRVPGNNAVVCSLQEQLNKGSDINTAEERWQDLNVVSSLLKSFFRKLPEPLFTDDKYNDFIEANRLPNPSDRLKTLKKLIHDLPVYYFHTLKFLIGHLKTVADHSEKNKMEPRNLALVFGPTLVRTSEDNMTDMVTHMPDRYKIVETLIQHYTWFFSEEHEKDDKTPVDAEDVQPAPNIDHLLSNIGRACLLGEGSDSANSDSVKSKGSGGSKRDLTAKDFLATLSIMSAMARKRRKRPSARFLGSSTDDESEQEPIRAGLSGEGGGKGVEPGESDSAPCAEAEEDEEDEEEDEEEAETEGVRKDETCPKMPCGEESQSMLLSEEEDQRSEVKGRGWRGEDARSIVSGYSTLSTLGRSLESEGRGEDADDEQSELVSETDNESGFASRSLTQERPAKHTPSPPRTHYKPCAPAADPAPSRTLTPPTPSARPTPEQEAAGEGPARPASSSSSSSSQRLHTRPSFNSHRLIQCDTLARRRLKTVKAKAPSLDLPELSASEEDPQPGLASPSLSQSPGSRVPPAAGREKPPSAEPCSLAEQVRARLMGSAEELRSAGRRTPLSPETRRKRRAWRRHTVVASPTEACSKAPPLASAGDCTNNNSKAPALAASCVL
ncbi:rho GTPase-activating protein 23 isoform X3 [Electrophorus electricus]|uniref:rho GTPase-activating protein 23 isoform X3 n=1 Tax=Electrophorus electricus TaxID=8005 RepID=UPI0015CFD996|nr:rho GTPase-activating protein 23 isoform X3 [Electrophorus electricus]